MTASASRAAAKAGWLRRAASACDGATAAEFALVVPLLLVFVFGVIEFGRVMWVRNSLQSAVEDAARCSALNRPECASVEDYTAAAAMGVPVNAISVTLSQPACGKKVVATYEFTSIVPLIPLDLMLTASACRAAPPPP